MTGQIASVVGGVTFPLYGYKWIGDQTPRFRIPYDPQQLNRAASGSIQPVDLPPNPPPPPVS